MLSAPATPDEPGRLQTLHELRLHDGEPEAALDQLVQRLGIQLGRPHVAVVLVDADHAWASAAIGGPWPARPRDGAFADAVLRHAALLDIADATTQPGLSTHPLVQAGPRLRAWAGVPLRVDGHAVGALCALRVEPGALDAAGRDALEGFATLCEALLGGRLRERRLRRQNARVRSASLSSSDWLWETDHEGKVTWVSDSIAAHTGRPPEADIGLTMPEINRRCDADGTRSWDRFMAARGELQPFRDLITERPSPRGVVVTSISGAPVFDRRGTFRGYRGATSNITARLQAENAAKAAQALLAAAIEGLVAAVMITDADGHMVVSNAVWRRSVEAAGLEPTATWQDLVRAMVRAGLYPEAEGREEAFIAWRLSIVSDQGEQHEIRWRDEWRMVSARQLPSGHVVHMSIDITAQKRAELALAVREAEVRESRERLTAVLGAVPDLWFVIDAAGRYVDCSASQHPMLVRDWAALKGQQVGAGLSADLATQVLSAVREALRTGEVQRHEYPLRTRDGVLRRFEARVSPMSGDRVLYVSRDLTELRTLERDLLVMKRAVEAAAALPMAVCDANQPDLPVVYVNPAFESLTGYAPAEMLGRNCRILQGDLPPQPAVAKMREAIAARRECSVVVENVRRDGRRFTNAIHVAPVFDAGGRLTHFIGVLRDITRERAAEQALMRAEERWHFALEGAGDGVWDWDASTNRVFYSARWKRLLGWDEREVGDGLEEWSSRVLPEDFPAVWAAIQRLLDCESDVYQSEHRMRHRDGRELWTLDRGKVVARDATGRPLRIVGTLSDITGARQAEQALREKQAAELASQAKSQFLSRMSHEMRTPLNAVIGFAQLMRMTPGGDEGTEVGGYAQHVLDAGQHLLALINDVLDLQKVEEGGLSLALGPVGLAETVHGALELLQPAARQGEVHVHHDLAPDLWVRADVQRLRQVVLNIVSNAIKYNRPGGSVRLTGRALPDRRAELVVEDTGPGLTDTQLARLFQPFERLGKETSGVEGTGLGLIIARSLAQALGGRLEVSSRAGRGTRVTIALLRDDAPHTDPADPEDPVVPMTDRDTPATPPALAPVRMLYVEDNRINAILFEGALRLHAHRVELRVAEDGEEALGIARAWSPEVLVLDAHLPGMSGFDVLRQLRQLPGLAGAPAYMCSADAMPEDLARAQAAGFIGYWTKPIDIGAVLADIDAVVRRLRGAPAGA